MNGRGHHARAAGDRPILFIGDSITAQWAVHRPSLFADNAIVNRGVGGETTAMVLARFADEVAACGPSVVHLLCGINDIAGIGGAFSLDATQANIAAMITAAIRAGCPPRHRIGHACDLQLAAGSAARTGTSVR